MKAKMFFTAVALALSMLVAGCEDKNNPVGPNELVSPISTLEGYWYTDGTHFSMYITNGQKLTIWTNNQLSESANFVVLESTGTHYVLQMPSGQKATINYVGFEKISFSYSIYSGTYTQGVR